MRRSKFSVKSIGLDTPERTAEAVIAVLNTSDGPIYDAVLIPLGWDWKRPRLSPNRYDQRMEGTGTVTFHTLRAGVDSHEHLVELVAPAELGIENFRPPCQFRFTDSLGRRWVRWPDQKLRRDRRPAGSPFKKRRKVRQVQAGPVPRISKVE